MCRGETRERDSQLCQLPPGGQKGFNDERHPHTCAFIGSSFIEHLLHARPCVSHRMSKTVRGKKRHGLCPLLGAYSLEKKSGISQDHTNTCKIPHSGKTRGSGEGFRSVT